MRAALVAAVWAACGSAALAEMRDEEHVAGGKLVRIAVIDPIEIMTVGRSEYDKIQVLSGADIEIVALAGDPDSVAVLGQPVLVADVTGTQSCETGDARDYYVVTLGEVPAPVGPVTTCQALTARVEAGALLLEGPGEAWVWTPDKGWDAGPG